MRCDVILSSSVHRHQGRKTSVLTLEAGRFSEMLVSIHQTIRSYIWGLEMKEHVLHIVVYILKDIKNGR
jgi:adenine specific DNA methylase Mod